MKRSSTPATLRAIATVTTAAALLLGCEAEPGCDDDALCGDTADAGADGSVDAADTAETDADGDPDSAVPDIEDTGGDPDTDALEDTDTSADTDTSEDADAPEDADAGPDPSIVRFDLGGDGFFDTPWPSDTRLREDGTPDLTTFPRATTGPLPTFRAAIEGVIHGFSSMSVVYVGFRAPIDVETLPTTAETLDADASVQLIDLSTTGCGARVPLRIDYDAEGDPYRDAHTLAARPVTGFQLRPDTRYALVILDDLTSDGAAIARPRAFQRALDAPDSALGATFDGLEACLIEGGVALDDVIVATAFTTQDATSELQRVRDHAVDPTLVDDPVVSAFAALDDPRTNGAAAVWRGTYATPIYQRGVSPYPTDGAFAFDDDGAPEVQRWEGVPFVVGVPEGDGPFPVLVFIDGTGFSLQSALRREPVTSALRAGLAVAAFAPQFHDTRAVPGSDPVVHGFNYVNPTSGRTVFRQQVVDTAYFVRVLRQLDTDSPIADAIDTSQMVYGGHSQGGIVGSFVAGVEDAFNAYVLNGTGTYLSVTITRRTDPIDIPALIEQLFSVGEPIDTFHPLAALVQLGTDAVEPHNYAPLWRGRQGAEQGAHVMVVNGWNDTTTFPESMDGMALSGDLDVVAPAGWDVDEHDVWERPTEVAPPIAGNRESLSGAPLTFATFLDRDGGHSTFRYNARIRDAAVRFWVEAIDGVPTIPIAAEEGEGGEDG